LLIRDFLIVENRMNTVQARISLLRKADVYAQLFTTIGFRYLPTKHKKNCIASTETMQFFVCFQHPLL